MDRISTYKKSSLSHRLQREDFARLISNLVNPLLLPPLVIVLISWMLGLQAASLIWVAVICLLFYTFIPVSATLYLLKKKHISSIDLPERKSRNRPFLFSITCAAVAFWCLNFTSGFTHPLLGTIAFIFLLNLSIGFLINLKWKMSIHTSALSSAGAIFFVFSYLDLSNMSASADVWPEFILLLLMPLVIWARYRLNIHSFGELIGGALTGFLLTVIELSLLINIG